MVGLGEEFQSRYVLATLKYLFRKFWILAKVVLISGWVFNKRGKGLFWIVGPHHGWTMWIALWPALKALCRIRVLSAYQKCRQ